MMQTSLCRHQCCQMPVRPGVGCAATSKAVICQCRPSTLTDLWAAAAVHETIRVKSAAWDDNGVLIYTTLNHVKYCLANGDAGIVRTLDVPIYITKVFGDVLFCLDRDGKHRQIKVGSWCYSEVRGPKVTAHGIHWPIWALPGEMLSNSPEVTDALCRPHH